jgi:hypothetical protein
LWRGDGTSQLSYYRGESKFSDHRPVCGTFIVEVEALNRKARRRSSNADMRIGAEELLPKDKNKGKGTAIFSHSGHFLKLPYMPSAVNSNSNRLAPIFLAG